MNAPQTHAAEQPVQTRPQFTISCLLWLMVAASLVLAYLRMFDRDEMLSGLVAIGIGLAVGGFVGAVVRRLADTMYWSLLGALFAFVCTAGYDLLFLFHPWLHYGWMLIGAAAGACGGARTPGRPAISMLAGGFVGGAVLGTFALVFTQAPSDFVLEVAFAAIVGAMLAAVIEIIYWVERRNDLPRYVTATGLLFAVIAGNVTAKFVLPGW